MNNKLHDVFGRRNFLHRVAGFFGGLELSALFVRNHEIDKTPPLATESVVMEAGKVYRIGDYKAAYDGIFYGFDDDDSLRSSYHL